MRNVGRDGRLGHRQGMLRGRPRLVADHNLLLRSIIVAGHHRYGTGTSHSGAKQEAKQQISHAGHFGHLPCFIERHIKLGRRNHLTRYVRRPSFSHAIVRQLGRRTILSPAGPWRKFRR